MLSKYERFEIYWDRARFHIWGGSKNPDHDKELKHIAWKCWQAGRKFECEDQSWLRIEKEREIERLRGLGSDLTA